MPGPGLPAALRDYLTMTTDQNSAIKGLKAKTSQETSGKLLRQAQVQVEIQAELRKAGLDPLAIGLRYVEIETINREVAAANSNLAADEKNLLTPAQLAKLKALEEPRKLQTVISQAACEGLLDPVTLIGDFGISPVLVVGPQSAGCFSFSPLALLPQPRQD